MDPACIYNQEHLLYFLILSSRLCPRRSRGFLVGQFARFQGALFVGRLQKLHIHMYQETEPGAYGLVLMLTDSDHHKFYTVEIFYFASCTERSSGFVDRYIDIAA